MTQSISGYVRLETPDVYDELAKRLLGVSAAWHWHSVSCVEPASILVVGAEAPPLLSGKRKGRPNWRKLNKSTERTFVVTCAQCRASEREWELETGRCWQCAGNGTSVASVHYTEGTTYRDCSRCGATGKAKRVA